MFQTPYNMGFIEDYVTIISLRLISFLTPLFFVKGQKLIPLFIAVHAGVFSYGFGQPDWTELTIALWFWLASFVYIKKTFVEIDTASKKGKAFQKLPLLVGFIAFTIAKEFPAEFSILKLMRDNLSDTIFNLFAALFFIASYILIFIFLRNKKND